ncbi:hypothetical protein BV20DRAFT_751126 [Pilatotrama ljubarskyi]|nr:hypothetical protein BV20DRAFT_751126 [Pilatotrama ljubarskyi]
MGTLSRIRPRYRSSAEGAAGAPRRSADGACTTVHAHTAQVVGSRGRAVRRAVVSPLRACVELRRSARLWCGPQLRCRVRFQRVSTSPCVRRTRTGRCPRTCLWSSQTTIFYCLSWVFGAACEWRSYRRHLDDRGPPRTASNWSVEFVCGTDVLLDDTAVSASRLRQTLLANALQTLLGDIPRAHVRTEKQRLRSLVSGLVSLYLPSPPQGRDSRPPYPLQKLCGWSSGDIYAAKCSSIDPRTCNFPIDSSALRRLVSTASRCVLPRFEN